MALAFTPLQSVASEWVRLPGYMPGFNLHIDVQSVAPRGKVVKAWFKTDYQEPQPASAGTAKYTAMKELFYFHCAEKTLGNVQRLEYGDDGKTVYEFSLPASEMPAMVDVVPDTLGEKMLKAACARVSGAHTSGN